MARKHRYNYNPETLLYEEQEEPRAYPHLRRIAATIGGVILGAFYIWVFIHFFGFESPRSAHLRRQNARWTAKMELLDRQMDLYETTLSGIEERDDHVYRSIFGLKEIPDELKKEVTHSADPALEQRVKRMDVLSRRAYIQSKALDEVSQISSKAGDMLSCIPAIPPMVPDKSVYHLSSPFGSRKDPVFGYTRFHNGQDFAMKPGTPLYATADGVVEKVRYQFFGYGNELIIDHGFGYKTLYAHLSSIEVTQGMQVKRGDKVAESGNSGKSTGPHLHYEVHYKGKPVNPYNYMDLTMSPKEYKSMVEERRKANQSSTGRKSTGELLKRRR